MVPITNRMRNTPSTAVGNKVSDDLRMQLKGNTAVINGETVLSTDIAGLGVRIENAADNSLFAVGENNWTPFNVNTQPQLKAVPVKQSGVQLTAVGV